VHGEVFGKKPRHPPQDGSRLVRKTRPGLDLNVNRGKLRSQKVLWPFRKRPHDSLVTVYLLSEVEKILARRSAGKVVGMDNQAARSSAGWMAASSIETVRACG